MHWLAKTGTGSGFIGIELTTHLWPQKTLHTAVTQGPSTWQEVWPCHRHDSSPCLVHGEPCQSQLIWSPTHFPLQLTNQWHNSEVSHSHHYSIHTYSMCRNSPLDRAPHTHTVRTYIPISPTVCSKRQAEWAHEPKQSFYHYTHVHMLINDYTLIQFFCLPKQFLAATSLCTYCCAARNSRATAMWVANW